MLCDSSVKVKKERVGKDGLQFVHIRFTGFRRCHGRIDHYSVFDTMDMEINN